MTTAVMTEKPAVFEPANNYRLSATGLLRSEWTKLWSLRSTWIVMLVAALISVGIALPMAGTYDSGQDGEGFTGGDVAVFGIFFSAIFIAVLAALFITGEYSTGSIRSTMAAAPRRTSVLWAKAAVFGAVVFALFTVVVFSLFFATQALLSGTDLGGLSLSDPYVFRALAGNVVVVTYLALLGLIVGAIVRNAAGAISFFIGVIMLLPDLSTLLPWEWVGDALQYSPGSIVNPLLSSGPVTGDVSLSTAWIGLFAWLVFGFGLAGVLLKRRDV